MWVVCGRRSGWSRTCRPRALARDRRPRHGSGRGFAPGRVLSVDGRCAPGALWARTDAVGYLSHEVGVSCAVATRARRETGWSMRRIGVAAAVLAGMVAVALAPTTAAPSPRPAPGSRCRSPGRPGSSPWPPRRPRPESGQPAARAAARRCHRAGDRPGQAPRPDRRAVPGVHHRRGQPGRQGERGAGGPERPDLRQHDGQPAALQRRRRRDQDGARQLRALRLGHGRSADEPGQPERTDADREPAVGRSTATSTRWFLANHAGRALVQLYRSAYLVEALYGNQAQQTVRSVAARDQHQEPE